MYNIQYLIASFFAPLLLPILYWQGKRIRSRVPKLPAAKAPRGKAGVGEQPPFQLVTLGESTIAGLGVVTHKEGFSGTLAAHLSDQLERQVEWEVYAKSGYTAADVRRQLVPKLPAEAPDLIVIGLGGNNAFGLHPPWVWRRQVRQLIQDLRKRYADTPIVFTDMPPVKSFPAFTPLMRFLIGNLVEMLGRTLAKEVARHPGVYYYDHVITFEDWSKRLGVSGQAADFFSDGVHPSQLTYQVWARDIANFIRLKVDVS